VLLHNIQYIIRVHPSLSLLVLTADTVIFLKVFFAAPNPPFRFGEVAGLPVCAVLAQADPGPQVHFLGYQTGPERAGTLERDPIRGPRIPHEFFALPNRPRRGSRKGAIGSILTGHAEAGEYSISRHDIFLLSTFCEATFPGYSFPLPISDLLASSCKISQKMCQLLGGPGNRRQEETWHKSF